MKTPICDFVEKYAQNDNLRLHMPGHKGVGNKNEAYDITEINGADSLYEANGIIAESEAYASELFCANTFYSAEGSSLAIRAMTYLATLYAHERGKKPIILAGRNAHKAFISSAALIGFETRWLVSGEGSYLSCKISAEDVKNYLDNSDEIPTALYLTTPDYLGNMTNIREISELCHKNGILLLIDNAHGAYLGFLPESMHPIALGADMCCDSAHKTLPALTGAAYLHVSKDSPTLFTKHAKSAMSLFGSTSPSYLILASLDRVNSYLSDGFKENLRHFIDLLSRLKHDLTSHGYRFIGDEPMKLTISAKEYGYRGTQIASYLEALSIIPEFADPDYVVLMPTPENSVNDIEKLRAALLALSKKPAIKEAPPRPSLPVCAMSIRDAILCASETVKAEDAEGRILAAVTVGCPPAIPIVVSGEVIDEQAISCFKYYGIESCSVLKSI